jgi:hypothetical protein
MVYSASLSKSSNQNTYSPLVTVNTEACNRLASFLQGQDIPTDKEEISLHHLSPKEVGNFYFFLVAICHQTSPINDEPLWGAINGSYKKGWDYLTAKFEVAVADDKLLLRPAFWQSITLEKFQAIFHVLQNEGNLPNPQRRVTLINDLGKTMLSNGWHSLDDIYHFCHGRVQCGEPSLLSTLQLFEAYQDPVQKKSLYLLSIMSNSGLWNYQDPENLGPPVDYHEVRGHLRIGTVSILDEELHYKLLNRIEVTEAEDIAIRQAVFDAIMRISELTGLTPARLHYLFWNIFRSCCTRENPHCLELRNDCTLPDSYRHLAKHSEHTYRCPFSDICQSAELPKRYYEHVFQTEYY